MRQNGKNSANIKRTNLRPQVLSGKSKNTGRPFDDAWLKEKWPELLDAHYQCLVLGQSACLQDALRMITTGKVFITCLGAKKEKEQEPRTLSQLEVQVIKEWYDAKDQKLVGSCSGEASSRAQAAAQKRKWLRSGASKAKGKSKGRANGKAKAGSTDGGNVKGLRVQLQVPHRYWQMWYFEKGSKCLSWGDSTKETYAGSLQKDAFFAGIAWLHATHTKMVEAKPCVPKPLAPQLQIANASLAIGSPSTVVRPATLGDPTPLDQTLLASRLHPQPSTTSTPATRRSVNAGAMPSLIIGDAMTDKSLTMDGQGTQEDAKRVGEHTLESMSAAADAFVSRFCKDTVAAPDQAKHSESSP